MKTFNKAPKFVVLFSLFISAVVSAAITQAPLLKSYGEIIDMAAFKGQTYLSFMQTVVKPAMDKLATEGYPVAGGAEMEAAYNAADKKVRGNVEKNGGIENVKRIAEALKGKIVTLETLPAEIAKVDRTVDRYNLATFIGLASGGGVVIQHYVGNYSYNVHYDTVEQKSGRSFGASPVRGANDASDKAYLDDLNEYSREVGTKNLPEFFKALMESLINNDPENYPKVTAEGQNVLTDFLAVYTAEQARNIMDGKIDIHWDAALLEVTLLSSFHAGQKEFKFFYFNTKTQTASFTGEVYNQNPCVEPTGKMRVASMRDYWQFSRRITDPKNCKRSGINITKSEFRKLGTEITAFMTKKYPKLVEALKKEMGLEGRKVTNLYYELSKFLINDKTPKKLGEKKANDLSHDWATFLVQVTNSAQDITEAIECQVALNK